MLEVLTEEYSVCLWVGLACAAAQVLLWIAFSFALGNGPWRQEPGFTAHQVVCFPLMIILAYLGVTNYYAPDDRFATPESRVLEPHPVGTMMSQMVLGMMVFWDIPTGLLVQSLREPLMVAHHFGMALTAMLGLSYYSYHALFFYGIIELSGIFLSIVDLFHPKHAGWCAVAPSRTPESRSQ